MYRAREKLEVWIPTYNCPESLACCLSSLAFAIDRVQTKGHVVEVNILDNGDRSAIDLWEVRKAISLLDRLSIRHGYFRNTKLRGVEQIHHCMAMNAKMNLCVIASDVVLEPEALDRLVHAWMHEAVAANAPFVCGARIDVDNFEYFDDFSRQMLKKRNIPVNLLIHSYYARGFLAKVNQCDTAISITDAKMLRESNAYKSQLDVGYGAGEDRVASGILVDKYGKGVFVSDARAWHYGSERVKKPLIADRASQAKKVLISLGYSEEFAHKVNYGLVEEEDVFN